MATEEKRRRRPAETTKASCFICKIQVLFPLFAIPAKAKTAYFDFLTAFVRYS